MEVYSAQRNHSSGLAAFASSLIPTQVWLSPVLGFSLGRESMNQTYISMFNTRGRNMTT
jgi:hypothetical protein